MREPYRKISVMGSMDSTIKFLALLAAILFLGVADVSGQTATEIRPYPYGVATQGCYLAEYRNKYLSFGQTWPVPGKCMSVRCQETSQMPNGQKAFVLYYAGCGTVAAMKPCWVVADDYRPHPHCCPTIKCPNDELNSNSVYDFK